MTRLFMHRVVHAVLTFIIILLAVTWLDGSDTFIMSVAYSVMSRIMTEHNWGVVAGIVGWIAAISSFASDWRVRVASAGLLSFAHAILAFLFFLGNPHAAAYGIFGGYAILGACLAYSTAFNSQVNRERDEEPMATPDLS